MDANLTYNGRRVFMSVPSDLWIFANVLGSIDDLLGDTHFVRQDESVSHAWSALLRAVEDSMSNYVLDEGVANISDMVTLALKEGFDN